MSYENLEHYYGLESVNDIPTIEAMWEALIEMPPEQQLSMWMIDPDLTGKVCLFTSERWPGLVLEYVQGDQNDSITTLCKGHPIFNSLGDLRKARADIIYSLGAAHACLPSVLMFPDNGRERRVRPYEMGTLQLLDMTRMMRTNNLNLFKRS